MTILIFPSQALSSTVNSSVRAWNYGTLKTRVASWGERSDLTATIPDFVDYAHQEICRRLRGSINTTTADLTINAETVDLPADFAAMRRLYLDTTPRRPIRLVSVGALATIQASFTSAAWPTHASIEGDQLVFAPVSGGSYTGKLLYWAIPTGLDADADTNVVLAKYPFLYLYSALAELFRYIEDDNNADRYQVKFDALIDDINRREAFDAMAGDIQGQASGLVI